MCSDKTKNISRCSCKNARTSRFLVPALLLILSEGPSHGYELTEKYTEFGFTGAGSDPGAIYRTLKLLGSDGFIKAKWKTDEPAYCTMTYTEGVAGGVEPTVIEADEISYAERHVEVIVDFAPATVYQFWLNCQDEAENTVQSENFVLFTPIQEKSIIDLILENFESTFGWVKNITG